jgi:hypothetical protein
LCSHIIAISDNGAARTSLGHQVHKLISELNRLYLPPGAASAPGLGPNLLGERTVAVDLVDAQG